jgi:hypothetical protein
MAATLASLWRAKANFWLCMVVGGSVRMMGALIYLLLSSFTLNENLFSIFISNAYALLVRSDCLGRREKQGLVQQ